MVNQVYLDTSALAKWYLNESRSQEFTAWFQTQPDVHLSSLTLTEFRCRLARRRRAGELSIELEQQIFITFERDLSKGYFMVHPLNNSQVVAAVHLINQLPQVALRTLDAIHLSIARDLEVETLATADKVMAEAGECLGFQVVRFD